MIENSHHRKIGISRKEKPSYKPAKKSPKTAEGRTFNRSPETSEEQRKIRPNYY
jgi:hypothetical protein